MSTAARKLIAMGITPWVLRGRTAEAEPERAPGTWVLQACEKPVATVVVAWPDRGLDLGHSSEAGELLQRILGALERPVERFAIVGWLAGEPAPNAADEPVFCFADQAPSEQPGWVMLPSLTRMLSEGRAAKAPAWQTLKGWLGRLAR